MKLVSTFFAVLLSLLSTAQLPTEGLRAYYPFSGNAEDEANYNDGIGVGVVLTEDRFGASNCAYDFSGDMASLILIQGMPDFNISPDSSLSISLWFNGGSDDAGDWESLFIKYGDPIADPIFTPSYGLLLYDLNKPLMTGDNASLWMEDNVNPFPSDGQWHHLVGVFKAGDWKIYFDNQLVSTWTDPAALVAENVSDVAIGTNFEGKIDDIAFYGRDLSADEVDQLYNMPSSCLVDRVEEQYSSNDEIFPNPAQDVLQLKLDGKANVEIRSISGKLVNTIQAQAGTSQIDVSQLAEGVYVMTILTDGHLTSTHRLVITR